jgi:hypothetical protein
MVVHGGCGAGVQKIFLHRRAPYDIDRAQKRFKKAGLTADNSARILRGE